MQMRAGTDFVLDLACTMVNCLTAFDSSQLRRVAGHEGALAHTRTLGEVTTLPSSPLVSP
jgi:hypothetical protein